MRTVKEWVGGREGGCLAGEEERDGRRVVEVEAEVHQESG